jgi:AcrR family transcriptional regulator
VSAALDVDTLPQDQRERRGRIVRTAVRFLSEQEYERIQVKDVAAEAQVALGTLYRYFSSKDHLFAAALQAWSEGFGRHVAEHPPQGTAAARVKFVFRRAARAFERQPHVYGVILALRATTDPSARAVVGLFNQQQIKAFGAVLPRLASSRRAGVVSVMSAVLDANLREWHFGHQPMEAVYAAIDEAADLMLSRR